MKLHVWYCAEILPKVRLQDHYNMYEPCPSPPPWNSRDFTDPYLETSLKTSRAQAAGMTQITREN